jgi:hypothetical protein
MYKDRTIKNFISWVNESDDRQIQLTKKEIEIFTSVIYR